MTAKEMSSLAVGAPGFKPSEIGLNRLLKRQESRSLAG
jgi:hypothetical protein